MERYSLKFQANCIKTAKSPQGLLDALQSFEDELPKRDENGYGIVAGDELAKFGIDICELPHWGEWPSDDVLNALAPVWSWSEDELLVGAGPFGEWRIVPREQE
jgi:hypothetical protein